MKLLYFEDIGVLQYKLHATKNKMSRAFLKFPYKEGPTSQDVYFLLTLVMKTFVIITLILTTNLLLVKNFMILLSTI